jgi:hypothetical protein
VATKKRKTPQQYRESWLDRRWRPAMGWMYFVVCITDFILFPILWSVFMARYGTSTEVWQPLTLQGGGLFHISMGAVIGVAAWTRGQEKLARYGRGHYDGGYGYEETYEETEINPMEPVVEDPPNQVYRYRG